MSLAFGHDHAQLSKTAWQGFGQFVRKTFAEKKASLDGEVTQDIKRYIDVNFSPRESVSLQETTN